MHLSVRTLHGIRTVTELSRDPSNSPKNADELASQKYMSQNYLIQILSTLRKAGIIDTLKGPNGGYRLAKSPDNITLGEIIRALEGPTFLSPCTQPDESDCEITDECSTQSILSAVADKIESLMDKVTIADIRDETTEVPLELDRMNTEV